MVDLELTGIGVEETKLLLISLGYDIDENKKIIEKDTRRPVLCPITKREILLQDVSIMPGSTLLINTSAFTMSEYFSKYFKEK